MSGPQAPLHTERLRHPSAGERAAILALEAAAFSNPRTPGAFDKMLETDVSRIYVVRDAAGIVAFCAGWLFEDELHINTIAVDVTRRRQGIGRALLQAVLRDTGARRATLEVRASNTAALALYESLGFAVTATRPAYYENPEENALILWLNP